MSKLVSSRHVLIRSTLSLLCLLLMACEKSSSPGPAGADGSKVLVDAGPPATSLGSDGDVYLDSVSGEFYTRAAGTWTAEGTLRSQGINGRDGATWFANSGEPSLTLGAPGDFYLDLSKSTVYKKSDTVWAILSRLDPLLPQRTFVFRRGLFGYSGVKDIAGASDSPTANINAAAFPLRYSRSTTADSQTYGLMRFDVSSVATRFLTSGESCATDLEVGSASLTLHFDPFSQVATEGSSDVVIAIQRPPSVDFVEAEATWSRPSAAATSWAVPSGTMFGLFGGRAAMGAAAVDVLPNSSGYPGIEIKLRADVVKDWICNPANNSGMSFGLIVRNAPPPPYTFNYVFNQSEHFLEAERPTLKVEVLRRSLNSYP